MTLNIHPIISDDVNSIVSIDNICWDKLRNKTVLITGAAGLIGSYVVYTLLSSNEQRDLNIKIIGLVRNKEKAEKQFGNILVRDDFTLLIQDITKELQCENKVDYIIHAASLVGRLDFIDNPVGVINTNLDGTHNLLNWAVNHPIEEFLFISSREIYGESISDKRFISENDYGVFDPTLVRSSSPESKRMAENLCVSYASQYHLPIKIVRFDHVYGPDYSLSSNRVWEDFIEKAIAEEDIVLHSDGSGEFALTYVSEAVFGLLYVLLNGNELVYNVSNTSEIVTVRELAEMIAALAPEKKIKVMSHVSIEDLGYLKNKVALMSDDKVRSFGWIAERRLIDGMKKIMCIFSDSNSCGCNILLTKK